MEECAAIKPPKKRGPVPWSGRYCCIPDCKSCSSAGLRLCKVPSGKKYRHGRDCSVWAKYFHRVICLSRDSRQSNLVWRLLNGKVYICSKHFRDDDFEHSKCKATIKFGRLPTLNLPHLNGKVFEIPEQWTQAIEASRYKGNTPTVPRITTFESLIESIQVAYVNGAIHTPTWRMDIPGEKSVKLDYFKRPLMPYIRPDQSIIISEDDTGTGTGFTYTHVMHGQLVTYLDYEIRGKTIQQFLNGFVGYELCKGSPFTHLPLQPGWREVSLMSSKNPWDLETRYLSDGCCVAVKRRTECSLHGTICQSCIDALFAAPDPEEPMIRAVCIPEVGT